MRQVLHRARSVCSHRRLLQPLLPLALSLRVWTHNLMRKFRVQPGDISRVLAFESSRKDFSPVTDRCSLFSAQRVRLRCRHPIRQEAGRDRIYRARGVSRLSVVLGNHRSRYATFIPAAGNGIPHRSVSWRRWQSTHYEEATKTTTNGGIVRKTRHNMSVIIWPPTNNFHRHGSHRLIIANAAVRNAVAGLLPT